MYIVAQGFVLTDSQNKSDVTYMYMYTITDFVRTNNKYCTYHSTPFQNICKFHVFNYA